MLLRLQLAAFICLALATSARAGTWRGYLVDARCYQDEEENVSPRYSLGSAGRDMVELIELCAPKERTKSFGLVRQNWKLITLDSDSGAKASEFIRKTGKRQNYFVEVTGQLKKKVLNVDNIAPADSPSSEAPRIPKKK